MRLTDLDARFLKVTGDRTFQMVDLLAEADGIIFQCPKCAEGKERSEEEGRKFVRGAHSVICWFRGKVPDDLNPKPGRWTPSGTCLDDLTFVPGDPAWTAWKEGQRSVMVHLSRTIDGEAGDLEGTTSERGEMT